MTERPSALQPGSGQALVRMIGELRNSLIYMKENGCTGFDASPETLERMANLGAFLKPRQAGRPETKGIGQRRFPPSKEGAKPSRPQPPAAKGRNIPQPRQPVRQETPDASPMQPPPRLSQGQRLEMIRTNLVGDCQRCRLCLHRRSIVFGEGNPDARLMFVGDGPRTDEDGAGHFYAGKAGELLLKILEAMNLTPEEVYIASVVKCRLPDRALPGPEEIRSCLPFLQHQIRTVQPEFICALGKVAAQVLLNTSAPITELRGKYYHLNGMTLVPTYHPAYLVMQPKRKREAWSDLKMLMQKMKPSR